MAFGNTEEKGENAGNQHFLLFPQCFPLYLREKLSFYQHLIFRLQVLSISSCPKKEENAFPHDVFLSIKGTFYHLGFNSFLICKCSYFGQKCYWLVKSEMGVYQNEWTIDTSLFLNEHTNTHTHTPVKFE